MFLEKLSRRKVLERMGAGFGMIPMLSLMQQQSAQANSGGLHFAPRAKRVLFLFMNGGPSHVDTFDPKPKLAEVEGQQPEGMKTKGTGFMPSPFRFSPHGESGVVMSELFPMLSQHADEMCVIRSMHTDTPNHEPGLILMHSGTQQPTRPCFGSWVSYGLGTENENLPAFVALCPGMPVVGPQLWSSGFLPASHQALSVNTSSMDLNSLVAHLDHPALSRDQQRNQLNLVQQFNRIHAQARDTDDRLEANIRTLELAYNMQAEATEAFDVSREPAYVHEAYGKSNFAQSCLLARRLLERGVRFVQVYFVDKGKQPWDTHQDNDGGHRRLCADSDRATAALLMELKQRGMLEDTLVIWGGEFGRTPYSQNDKENKKPGRDHHATGFSMFLAGGGVRGGTMYGETDELGMHAVENRVHVHDLHATLLHLLGIDHTRLTYRYSGRDYRLTDIHGEVVTGILA
ncbi:MAG: DUF1501 domain-containing protein [Planctomycetales bacterium]|nr:DUF1501 domain-containing protein [Planctomycetales bacterium]